MLALLAALGLLVAVVAGYLVLPDTARDSFDELMGRRSQDTGFTGWFWTSAVCALAALVPAALAVRLAPAWPEMGARYDAPGADAPRRERASTDPERDLWQALDDGRDPTDTRPPQGRS